MPKINRIRITNFIYNNRHIIDETFDFYNGENALLSLANGGGKSVLVQTIFQPIVPKTKLLGRSFSDFFIGKKDPVYIMIEWILDDQAGYLLTGIGISSSINYTLNSDEDNLNLRFYTYMHHYEEANPFDIKHIPVTEEKNNGIVISGYSELKKILNNEANKGKYDIDCYNSSKEEQTAYERKLSNYSISRNEWKELMVNINQAEHGVSEVFAQCKNSRQVMEQWIIKYIENVLDKSSEEKVSDHQKLEQMMNQVAIDEVENENFISEYQEISKFINDLKEIEAGAKEVCDMLDVEEQKRVNLASAYHFFNNKLSQMKDKETTITNEKLQNQRDMEHIELEKKSYEIYLIKDRIQELTDELEKVKEQLAEIEYQVETNQYELNLHMGAREFEVVREKTEERAELEQSLENASKNQEQLLKEMNQIKYSLKCYYSKIIENINNDLSICVSRINQLTEEKNALNESIDSKNEQKENLILRKGELNNETKGFVEYEKTTFLELGIELYRNPLLNELNVDEINSIKEQYFSRINKLSKALETDQLKIEELNNSIERLKEVLTEIADKIEITSKEQFENDRIISDFERKKDEIQSIISIYCNDHYGIFDNESILGYLRDQHSQWHQKALRYETEINELIKMVNGLKEGVSYIPASLVSTLKANNIDIYTGESYLRSLAVEARKQIIHDNPLLPYGMIVSEKESELIQELIEDTNLGQLVPLFKHADKEMSIETLNCRVLSNPQLLEYDQKDLVKYVEKIETQKENLVNEKIAAEETSRNYYGAIKEVENFQWTEDDEKRIFSEKTRISKVLCNLKDDQESANASIEHFRQDIETLKEKCLNAKDSINQQKEELSLFEAYLNRNNQYMTDLELLNQVKAQEKVLVDELKQASKKRGSLKDSIIIEKNNMTQIEDNLNTAKENLELYIDAEDTDIIDKTESELLGKLKAFKNQMTDDVLNIQKRIENIDKDISRSNKNIERLGLVTADVRNIIYSEITEKEVGERLESLKIEKKNLTKKVNEIDKKISESNGELKPILSELNGAQKLEKAEIKGDFEARKDKLKLLKGNLEEDLKNLNAQMMLLSNMKERIYGKIENVDQIYGDVNFIMKVDDNLEAGVIGLINQFTETSNKANVSIKDFEKISKSIKDKHKDSSSSTVIEAIKGIYGQIDNLTRRYDKYYYLIERIDFYDHQLETMMKLMQSKIDQLDHSKKDLVEHAYIEAMRIYHEIPKIADNSSIEIEGTRRKILDIQYDKIQSDEIAKGKIKDHIQLCLENITQDIKNKEDESKIRKNIVKLLSTKELLNVVSNLENFKVKAYKVDINESNRRMMPWEEIIVKNSGGEKFVAYFSLLVALISYSRKNTPNSETFKKKEESKVLIMDNPFGPITSGHLLKPMFDIAKKYDTQLICLSDIKEGAVLNSFNLVYMIKIRQNTMKQEYLEVQENNFAGFKVSEKLEKAYLYTRTTQMSLFE